MASLGAPLLFDRRRPIPLYPTSCLAAEGIHMRWMALVGMALVVIGIIALVIQVIPVHHEEQVAKIGSRTATRDKETDYYVPPYAGVTASPACGRRDLAGPRRTA